MSEKGKFCQGKETFERMNFLYQAATEMAGKNNVLSCYYGNLCKSIARKSVLRMEPSVKRTICKRCGLVLKPGISAELNVNLEENKREVCELKCSKCSAVKRFVMNKDYALWLDDERSIVECFQPNVHSVAARSEGPSSTGPSSAGPSSAEPSSAPTASGEEGNKKKKIKR